MAKEMNAETAFIYFSGATDKTGMALKEALGISGDRNAPKKDYDVVIGWGAKTKDPVKFGKGHVLNHPDKIRDNRNKAKALVAMASKDVPVAAFVTAGDILKAIDNTKKTGIALPVIGRKNYHQGGKGFWLCVTKSQIQTAIDEGAQYFQVFIDIKDEFRLHVMGDKVLYAVKKVKRDDVKGAYVEQTKEALQHHAKKNNVELDDATLDFVAKNLSKDQDKVDMVIRSNKRGWKFSRVKIDGLNKDLSAAAISAISALGLDFGAVDCCIDSDGKAWVIEVNTGPGLDGTPFDAYVKAFRKTITTLLNPAPVEEAKKASTKKATTKKTSKKGAKKGSIKEKLLAKMALASELIEEADEEEAEALQNVISRCWGGSA